ncbi:uncharacterized protein LOC135034784 isoform X2 [Pseudophryne corroboree]|uniref:uncharacterized protein LOC135034784 isoform X2 n=1 Tax=Pseudophryne corroboree TaxID=495146 RepID=UPI0030821CD0
MAPYNMSLHPFIVVILLTLLYHHLHADPETWPTSYHAAKISSKHEIRCPLQAKNIAWHTPSRSCKGQSTHHGTLHLHNLRHRCTGDYACSDQDNKAQRYTENVVIWNEHALNVSCTVDSYTNVTLHCSVTEELTCPCRMRAKAHSSDMDQDWSFFTFPEKQRLFLNFRLPMRNFCPSEEQVQPIQVSVDIIARSEFRNGTNSTYISNIVAPKAPENVSVTNEQISWAYPSSWTHSQSFFPLIFEIWANFRNNTNVTRTQKEQRYSVKNVRTFTVRCRDVYNTLSWSSWTSTLTL